MTVRQQQFARHYRESGDAAAALKAAGYREKNAAATARRLLALPAIQEYLAAQDSAVRDRRIAGEEEVLEYLTQVLRGEHGSDRERLRAAELLGKRHGLFHEKNETDGMSVTIVDDLGG